MTARQALYAYQGAVDRDRVSLADSLTTSIQEVPLTQVMRGLG